MEKVRSEKDLKDDITVPGSAIQITTNLELKTIGINFLAVLEARKPTSRC